MKEKIVCTVEVVEVGWLAGSCQCYDSYLIGGAISYALSHTVRQAQCSSLAGEGEGEADK